jgi:alpha-amylase
LRKIIELSAGSSKLSVQYHLEDLPPQVPVHFAVEINVAAMAGHASDRFYSDDAGGKLGLLDDRLDLAAARGVTLTDEWLDMAVGFRWSRSADLWCFPIETVSQCEGSFEGVYQSSAVIPHWKITSDEHGCWDVEISWNVGRITPTPESSSPETPERLILRPLSV